MYNSDGSLSIAESRHPAAKRSSKLIDEHVYDEALRRKVAALIFLEEN